MSQILSATDSSAHDCYLCSSQDFSISNKCTKVTTKNAKGVKEKTTSLSLARRLLFSARFIFIAHKPPTSNVICYTADEGDLALLTWLEPSNSLFQAL